MKTILNWILKFADWAKKLIEMPSKTPIESPEPPIIPQTPPTSENTPKPEIEPILSKWDTPAKARHEIRVICDNSGLNLAEKNLLCQIINCESNFRIDAIHHNNNGTFDYSLCQYNSRWWVGKDKPFKDKQDVFDNPERQVKILIKEYKAGRLNQWVCYKTKKYLNFDA